VTDDKSPQFSAQQPLETWVSGPMPRHKGETFFVLRTEFKDRCSEVDALKTTRKALPWYFTLASGGASLALAGALGLAAYAGAPSTAKVGDLVVNQQPAHWLLYVYLLMVSIGATAALILGLIGLLSKSSYDSEINGITTRMRDMEYPAEQTGATRG
jgi:hypothetical protein